MFGKIIFLSFGLLGFAEMSFSQTKENMRQLVDADFRFADSQYHFLMKNIALDKVPQSYDYTIRKVTQKNIQWWCSGFYPGALLSIFEQTKDTVLWQEAQRILELIKPNQYDTTTHDLGFKIFCSFGNAFRLTKDTAYKSILLTAARTLAKRYRPSIKSLQSWSNNKSFKSPVIIDNMMNLELLDAATVLSADTTFLHIARNHANTTLVNHFRSDYSSYHVVDYDTATGKIIRKATHQGSSDSSAWARGQAWGLYGFTMMYRYTKDKKYLRQAQHIAQFIFSHPNLPKDKIPYWDFNAPDIPNAPRDVSAAAVTASALLELARYTGQKEKQHYVQLARSILFTLSAAPYKSNLGENGGFLLLHSTGNYPNHTDIDLPIIYADYYFLEALKRYKEWYL